MIIITVASLLTFATIAMAAFALDLLYDKELRKKAAHMEAERRNRKWTDR